jgi:hypothetical protein
MRVRSGTSMSWWAKVTVFVCADATPQNTTADKAAIQRGQREVRFIICSLE